MRLFLLFTFLLLNKQLLFGQACHQISIAGNSQQATLLRDYIEQCRKGSYFFDDKGIVQLISYQDDQGLTCWYLSALIDNRYRDIPPESYAYINNDIILIYQGNKQCQLLPIIGDAAARYMCIDEVVGSRVYEQSTKRQFVYLQQENGTLKKIPVIHMSGGKTHNDLIIRFNKDGTISKFIPV